MSDAYLQTKVCRNTRACPRERSGIWETNGAESAFFIPFLSVCALLTHTTQQGTHVMHHAVISDSEVEVITLGSTLPLLFLFSSLLPACLSGSALLCQPSIWWLETTHFIAVTRHDGPARPEPLDLFPAPLSSKPQLERQHVGRMAGLLICYGWTAREALTPFSSAGYFISVDLVIQLQLSVTMFKTVTVCELNVYQVVLDVTFRCESFCPFQCNFV